MMFRTLPFGCGEGGSDLCEVLKLSLRLEMDFSESLLPLPSQDLENSCGLEKANGQY